ncbi:MAG: DUF4203 domain-containing protein [Chloroflexi bacterium]|nr:DUF4203 domain-containing protein [Chloroflexota bacterium]
MEIRDWKLEEGFSNFYLQTSNLLSEMEMLTFFKILEGVALLTLGRRLFWLFVALIGFEVGAFVAARVFTSQPDWVVLVVAVGVGIIGALLAIFLQQLVVAAVGFFAGGYLGIALLELSNLDSGALTLIAFIVGGIIGTIVIVALFDWALIGLSSLVGALTLTQVFLPRHALALIAFVALFVLGVAIQAGWWQSEKRRAR